ncbi:hypothetical protein K0M31_018537 [Melipona bicolor]|uniref:Uncharacterized protein n=1 Tax=Melipona bicolor TaxID=60889 RepID=A0AA40KRS8_9HYME|nr:hypothetical protein K0M31_018537 [Melipona bicolor]
MNVLKGGCPWQCSCGIKSPPRALDLDNTIHLDDEDCFAISRISNGCKKNSLTVSEGEWCLAKKQPYSMVVLPSLKALRLAFNYLACVQPDLTTVPLVLPASVKATSLETGHGFSPCAKDRR